MRHHAPTQAADPPGQYVLVYDDACDFCTRLARRLQRRAREPLHIASFAELPAGKWLTELSDAQIRASSHFITPEGREYHGGESVTRALRLVRGGRLIAPLDLPGFTWLREAGYAFVAAHRSLVSRVLRV